MPPLETGWELLFTVKTGDVTVIESDSLPPLGREISTANLNPLAKQQT
jgi:hypothetical protein